MIATRILKQMIISSLSGGNDFAYGTDALKDTSPGVTQTYYAFDTDKLYYCEVAGTWIEYDEQIERKEMEFKEPITLTKNLIVNPGSAVIGEKITMNHSLGAGDCDDLIASYSKVDISGDGDSGLTAVGLASRAYVSAGAAQEVYGSQPWAKHAGVGSMLAMSGLSAALILNDAEAFESTNSINAGHFHIKTYAGAANGAVTSNNFDGVMIEIYGAVLGLRAGLNIAVSTATGIESFVRGTGIATTGIDISGATLTNELILSNGTTITLTAENIVFTHGSNTATITMSGGGGSIS